MPEPVAGQRDETQNPAIFIDNLGNVLLIEDITPDIRNMVAQSGPLKKEGSVGGA